MITTATARARRWCKSEPMEGENNLLGVLVGLLCATTWAVSSVLMKDLSRKLDPFALNAPRCFAGGLSMFLLALATGRTAYSAVTLKKLLFLLGSVAVGGGIGDTLYLSSMARIGISRSFPIASTYPALTLVFGLIFLREQISVAIVVGLFLVLGGVVLIGQPNNHSANEPVAAGATGVMLALTASTAWAISGILVAPGIEGLDSIMVASFRTPALSLMLFGLALLRGRLNELLKLSLREWIIVIVGGFIGWGLGSVLFLWTVALVGPTRAAILTSTAPLFALPLSLIFLKEKVTPIIAGGTVLTVVGIILVA